MLRVLRTHADGAPRVYQCSIRDGAEAAFVGIVKDERDPEDWYREFEVYYTKPVAGFLAPIVGHLVHGKFVGGLPILEACESDAPLGRDLFGPGGTYAPATGLCPMVMKDCGPTLSELRCFMPTKDKIKVAGKLVNVLRKMAERELFVTDLKLENMCLDGDGVIFIDPGSLVCGKTMPVTSAVVLANWLREPIFEMQTLRASLVAFAAAHPVAAEDRCVEAPVGEIVALSAKIAIAQLLEFGDGALAFFQPVDHIFERATTRIRVCVGDRESDYRDFCHFFCSAGHLVL